MHVVFVHVHVKPEHRDEFLRATLENAQGTIQEPGNLRFDVLQQADDPNRFVLYEVYRDRAGMEAHKQTSHYLQWRDTVGPWMAEPRQGISYAAMFPTDPAMWSARK